MTKWFNTFISLLAGLIIILILLLTSVEFVAFNGAYYQWHYQAHHIMATTGMSQDDLMYVTGEMLDYLKGYRDDLKMSALIWGEETQVFNERESLHMIDVRDLFVIGRTIRNIGLLFIIVFFILVFRLYRKKMGTLLVGINRVIVGFWSVLILMVVLISLDFNVAFTLFHQIFFTNDLWLFDPRTDVLIQMVPLSFFITTASLIFIIFLLLSGMAFLTFKKIKKKLT